MKGVEAFTLQYSQLDYVDDSKALLEDLRRIQSNILLLNEDNNNNNNNNNNSDSGGSNNIDADLDALLKDNGGGDNNSSNNNNNPAPADNNNNNNNADASLDDIPDLSGLDGEDEGSNEDKSSDSKEGESSEGGEGKNFETDSQGLVDAIQKLTKSGHTVKIVVQAENKNYYPIDVKNLTSTMLGETRNMYFSLNNRHATPKLLIEAANRLSVKGGKRMSNTAKAIFDELKSIRKDINTFKNGGSLSESNNMVNDSTIMIRESDYESLTEMIETLTNKVDEQEAIIKNYESLNEYNIIDESTDIGEINRLMMELDESTNQLNQLTNNANLRTQHSVSFATGIDSTFKAIQENVIPVLSELNEAKGAILNIMDSVHDNVSYPHSHTFSEAYIYNAFTDEEDEGIMLDEMNDQLNLQAAYDDMISIDESLEVLKKINSIDQVSRIFEDRINSSNVLTESMKGNVMSILSEASGDICLAPKDDCYDNTYPEYQYFSKVVYSNILNKVNSMGGKSDLSVYQDNSDMLPKNLKKFDLPIMNPEKWNAVPTVKSAIVQLTEGLTNLDGEFNIPLCEQAFLYKKVKKPESIKDFAMPIAVFDEGQLYAHPTLIKSTANILASDKCMKTYGIPTREELYTLRENLMPYLNAIGESAPWLEVKEKSTSKK